MPGAAHLSSKPWLISALQAGAVCLTDFCALLLPFMVFTGERMASPALFLQCVVSVLCSAVMDRWISLLGARLVYISSVALMVLATAFIGVSDSVMTVTVMTAVTGYTVSVLQVVPFTLLVSTTQINSIKLMLRMFHQVLPSLCQGYIVQLARTVRAYMVSACCFSLLAFLYSTKMVYSHADLQH
ncbi:hypothetical protein OYC64_011214 [Pagothenia borchgrevinki]|uniref:Solute carrier family 45 member 3 n=1 Tax=Pagothenia borchgrevinki TaxID=8213 RepID=A0ABD2GZ46_PAGBO